MSRAGWLGSILLGVLPAAWAAQVTVQPGSLQELACPPEATRIARQASGTPDAPPPATPGVGRAALRIGLWGDSHTAVAAFTEALLAGMQIEPQGMLPTFMAANWAIRGIAHPLRAGCVSPSWRPALAHQGARDVGAGLVSMSSEQQDSVLAFDFRWPLATTRLAAAKLHVTKQRADRSLVLAVSADGGPESLLALDGAITQPVDIQLARPAITLQVRLVAGEATVHGVAPVYAERARNHLDVFSIPGATVDGWRHANVLGPAFVASKPVLDLALLQYGTNDAPGAAQRPEFYAQVLRDSLRRFRLAYPGTRCVVLGPPDRGGRGAMGEHSQLHQQVSRMQQQLAREAGCDFWNWQLSMGGRGSAAAGAMRNPPTVQPDLTHLTALGYRESGLALGIWLGRMR